MRRSCACNAYFWNGNAKEAQAFFLFFLMTVPMCSDDPLLAVNSLLPLIRHINVMFSSIALSVGYRIHQHHLTLPGITITRFNLVLYNHEYYLQISL